VADLAPVVLKARDLTIAAVRRYTRLDIEADAPLPDEPALIVCNHGFGGGVDLNVYATYAALQDLEVTRPVSALVHELAWIVGLGPLVTAAGGLRASHESAELAFASGHHLIVFPGGDKEASKPFKERNRVHFYGRTGFARLAMEQGVPIVPVVTAGAGESVFVISDGQRMAKALRLNRVIRSHAVPLSLSIPWGLGILAGWAPYVPLPTKLRTAVLPAMWPLADEDPAGFALRVETAMQERMDQLVEGRRLLLG
jgi:1-acyl-sn-glycerol-3-phosphate acyltransferase